MVLPFTVFPAPADFCEIVVEETEWFLNILLSQNFIKDLAFYYNFRGDSKNGMGWYRMEQDKQKQTLEDLELYSRCRNEEY